MESNNDKRDIGLAFFTRYDIRQKEVGKALLELLNTISPQIAPEKMDMGYKRRIFMKKSILQILNKWGRSLTMGLIRERNFESELVITFVEGSNYRNINLWVEKDFFNNPMNVNSFLALSIGIYKIIHPEYGKIHLISDSIKMATFDHPVYGETIYAVDLKKGLPGIYWGNFIGPNFVEKLGRDKLLSIPCYRRIEFDDGGLFFALSPNYEVTAEMRKQQQEIRDLLGEGSFHPIAVSDIS
jgi:hypothetical protein